MKITLLVFALALFSISFVQAQTTHFGVKAGINISSLKVEGGNDYNSKIGIHAGGLAHIHITPHFAVQPELLFSAQGGKDGDFKIKTGYINLPVLAQFMTGEGFRIETGPQLGFLTSAKSKEGDVEVNVKDQLNTIDFSWAFGLGYLTNTGWGVDGRFNLGLTNVNDNDSPEIHNRVFQLGVFYQFMHTTHTTTRRRK